MPGNYLAYALKRISRIFREIFLPRRCLGCDTRETQKALCPTCLNAVPIYDAPHCLTCRARLPELRATCHTRNPYLLAAAGDYADPLLRNLILSLKFKRRRDAADALADLMARHIRAAGIDLSGYSAVPVPLSKRRERERGFNQAELIAHALAARIGIPVDTNIIVRARHTKPQSEISDENERRTNLAGAFAPGAAPLLSPKAILIDDVATSGATIREAAAALKAVGARRIIALVAAMA